MGCLGHVVDLLLGECGLHKECVGHFLDLLNVNSHGCPAVLAQAHGCIIATVGEGNGKLGVAVEKGAPFSR